ncbi:c-type cytochrome biogenesis protein CcsB [Heyndrickxia sp. NPDC080065]|uniref:c-type cytochrome biogenesis protein CcsB n=1 Tax=Heyndrickxia sp. NPDC080065 TaxID=3390568 RepID=UPI003CFF0D16
MEGIGLNTEKLLSISGDALFLAFILLLVAIVPIGFAAKSKGTRSARVGIILTYIAFALQIIYFICRWLAVDHAPVSNMYEFMTFFGVMLVGAFLVIHYLYKQTIIGLFAIPTSLLILGYGSVFTNEVSLLVPSLQSNWLTIHVITVAASSAILSIAFVTGIIYLLSTLDINKKTKGASSLESIMYFLVVIIGFILGSFMFNLLLEPQTVEIKNIKNGITEEVIYTMPILVANEEISHTNNEQIGFIFVSNTIDARKLNTILWSFILGSVLYLFIRIITRKRMIELLKPLTKKVNPSLMDEISYRAVLIGFPLFSLGGLFFAMIWAQIAWGRFWGWDPKEVWALITWLLYAALLHLRLFKSWEGERTAWLSIIGFGMIVFNQVFVNLVIAGLHSYA